MGLPVFRQQEMQTPSGHPLPRWRTVLSRGRLQTGLSSPRTVWSEPLSRFGSFDCTRFTGVHHVPQSVFPLARYPGAASRPRYFSARFAPPRYQGRTVQMRRGGQDHPGHTDHSILAAFTSHLEAVGSSAWFGTVSRVRRLEPCCIWDWNSAELIVPQPFDPGEDVSYSIEEAFVSREKPHAL